MCTGIQIFKCFSQVDIVQLSITEGEGVLPGFPSGDGQFYPAFLLLIGIEGIRFQRLAPLQPEFNAVLIQFISVQVDGHIFESRILATAFGGLGRENK